MILIHESLTQSEDSTAWSVAEVDEFCIAVETDGVSGYNGATFTLEHSPDNGSNWYTFTSGGSNVTFTSGDQHKTVEFGGSQFRVSADATAGSGVDVYVSGPNVIK